MKGRLWGGLTALAAFAAAFALTAPVRTDGSCQTAGGNGGPRDNAVVIEQEKDTVTPNIALNSGRTAVAANNTPTVYNDVGFNSLVPTNIGTPQEVARRTGPW